MLTVRLAGEQSPGLVYSSEYFRRKKCFILNSRGRLKKSISRGQCGTVKLWREEIRPYEVT